LVEIASLEQRDAIGEIVSLEAPHIEISGEGKGFVNAFFFIARN